MGNQMVTSEICLVKILVLLLVFPSLIHEYTVLLTFNVTND